MRLLEWLSTHWKAIAGYITPAVLLLGAFLLPDSDGGLAVTAQEWIGIVVAALSGGTVMYAVKRTPTKGTTNAD